MAKKTFRVARAGQTTDGREITRDHINQMAANYDSSVYGARVNLEHFRALYPDSTFKAYGDVVSLSTEEEDGQLYLLAEIDPTDDLIRLAKSRQKVYFSIELDPNFADTGEAYLVGLACTDSPASLGTSYMQFCQQHPESNPYTSRKKKPENLFSSADFVWEFEEDPKSIFASVKQKLNSAAKTKTAKEQQTQLSAEALAHLPQTVDDFKQVLLTLAESLDTNTTSLGNIAQNMSEFLDKQSKIESALTDVQDNLDTTPDSNYSQRPPATGTSDFIKSDC